MGRTRCREYNVDDLVITALLAYIYGIAGCTAQSISATQQLLDFGNVAAGGSSGTQTVTLVNYGDAATLAAISIQAMSGSPKDQFTITGGSCTKLTGPLQTTDTCTVTVQATPTVSGTVEALLTVTATNLADGAFTSQPVTFKVNGLVIQLATDLALDFGDVVVGSTSPAQAFLVVNLASVPAVLSGAGYFVQPAEGADSPQFKIANGSCITTGTLAPNGGQCKFYVTAMPTVAGLSKQYFMFKGPPASPWAPVINSLTVNGVSPTLPPSPRSAPPSPAHQNRPPAPPPNLHQHHPSPKHHNLTR